MATIEAHSVSLDNVEVTVWQDEQGEYFITWRYYYPKRYILCGGVNSGSGLIRRYLSATAAFKACQALILKEK